jgi:NADH:ubiquinone oxidoreductase subunit 2 (subunit N)
MRNYLARLGWGHGDDELFSDAQAIEWFDLAGIGKAPARLDFDKLAQDGEALPMGGLEITAIALEGRLPGAVVLVARKGHEAEDIDDLKGLSRRAPGLAFVMLLLMFSLAGIPPTVGFYAKLAVLQSVLEAGMTWLAILAVLVSLIGAFYYLRIVKTVYFDEPVDTGPIAPAPGARAVMAVNGALILLLGLVPGPLMTLCLGAVRQAFGI